MKNCSKYERMVVYAMLILVLSACTKYSNNNDENIETVSETNTETTENFILSEQILEKSNETADNIESLISFEKLTEKNDEFQIEITEYNTQESEKYSVKLYFELSGSNDYDYVYIDSDGFVTYQTPFFIYTDSYGEEICSDEDLPSPEDIYVQCDSMYNFSDEITDIAGEFEKDNKRYVVCEVDSESFSDNFTSWGNIDGSLFAVCGFSERKIDSVLLYENDNPIFEINFTFDECDENIESVMEKANEYFKEFSENK